MGFLKLIWGHEKQPPDRESISPEEIRRTFERHDRMLAELNEALAAAHGEPDKRATPHAP